VVRKQGLANNLSLLKLVFPRGLPVTATDWLDWTGRVAPGDQHSATLQHPLRLCPPPLNTES
jgi:hypothetical protein